MENVSTYSVSPTEFRKNYKLKDSAYRNENLKFDKTKYYEWHHQSKLHERGN